MAELKQWFRRIRCRLTGGHMYRDMGIVTRYEPITDRYWFGNRCIKCGQFNTWDVDAKALFEEGFARKKGDGNDYYKKQSSCTTPDGKEWFASGGG